MISEVAGRPTTRRRRRDDPAAHASGPARTFYLLQANKQLHNQYKLESYSAQHASVTTSDINMRRRGAYLLNYPCTTGATGRPQWIHVAISPSRTRAIARAQIIPVLKSSVKRGRSEWPCPEEWELWVRLRQREWVLGFGRQVHNYIQVDAR
eukprot:8959021-Pyramimonas_sp.AAC.1